MKMSGIATTTKATTQAVVPPSDTEVVKNLLAASQSTQLLKFKKGRYFAGDTEMPLGGEWLTYCADWQHGWVKFINNEIVDRRIGRVADGFRPPEREELGDTQQFEWETGPDGKPSDPWQFRHYLPLENLESGDCLIFVTSSVGGAMAVRRLCNKFARNIARGRPIVSLGVAEFISKKFGAVTRPDFTILSWEHGDGKTSHDNKLQLVEETSKDEMADERQWTVKDRVPASNVTLLSGEGSIGKSILSLQLAVAVVLGRDWLGTLPEQGPVVGIACEDDSNELWRRLDLIFDHYGAGYTDFKDLHLLALAGEETLMAVPDNNGIIRPTKLFERVQQAACDIRPKLILLDNSADIYSGNENDRAQVRQFIAILRALAITTSAGVLLTSHPSLIGINSGSGLSGSTAWNASVQSRLYFKRATTDKDEEPDPDLRVLEVMKSNYGPIGETITLRWNNGLFLPVGGVTNLEKLAAEQTAEHLFLGLLDRFNGQGRNTSDKPSASNYAPKLFALEKQAKDLQIRKKAFEETMRNLFAATKIRLEPYGPPSKEMKRLIVCK